ncbi:MAG: protein kinase [Planctomycetes bacterium]|nr:protein kinase [Planctomycetota bacterium]
MTESPQQPADTSRDETSRVVKSANPAAPSSETARGSDSVPVAAGPNAALPAQFGRYRIQRQLGRGAMGTVYLAVDGQLDRPVALKVARVSVTGSAKTIRRMEIEAKAAARIDHPLICKVYDFGEIEGIRFIAMQYIEGEDLKSYLKRVGRLRPPAEAVRRILQIAGALKAAHDQGVIHRDLKPENVMLNRSGAPVIMDFGLARHVSGVGNAGLTQGMILGTAAYMSPEQAAAKPEGIDHRSDLYALGVMLFEMVTGRWPFEGSAIELMGKKCILPAPSPLSLIPDLPPALAAVCLKLIAQKKEDRFNNCAEVIAALENIELEAPVSPKPIPASPTLVLENTPSFDFENEPAPILSFLETVASNSQSQSWPSVRLHSARTRRGSPSTFRWAVGIGSVICLTFLVAWLKVHNGDTPLRNNGAAGKPIVNATHGADRGKNTGARRSTSVGIPVEPDPNAARPPTESKDPSPGDATFRPVQNGSKSSPAGPRIPADAVTFQAKRFKLFTESVSWHDAKLKCREMGGQLAEVRSAAENEFLMNLAQSGDVDGVWLGATDELREGRWTWNDGSEVTYKNWSRLGKQPNNGGRSGNEHYLFMMIVRETGKWGDLPAVPVDWHAGYVCEWPVPAESRDAERGF